METTGDLRVIRGEITLEWEIKDFFPISDVIDKRYGSPEFYFSGSSWQISLYPNGRRDCATVGWIHVFIFKMSTGSSLELDYSINIKTIDGKILIEFSNKGYFPTKKSGWGWNRIISRLEIEKKKSDLSASNDIIVTCTMKNNESTSVTGSIFRRLKDVSDNLKEIFEKAKRTDCKLKFHDETIAAHRVILETRSPVFGAMFSHDTKENKTGEVCIEDIQKNTMDAIIEYIYSGDMDELKTKNVFPIYIAADKYDIKDIKEMCSDFIIRNLSVDWVCDVIKFADLYNEDEIGRRARQYFRENAGKILETDEWEKFAKENHDIGVGLLSSVVKALLPK